MTTVDSPEPMTSVDTRRAWLASLLLRRQANWFGRFALHLRRLVSLGRGRRRQLQRKASVSLAAAALLLSLGAGVLQPPAVLAASITVTTNTANSITLDGLCSINEAIANANDTVDGEYTADCATGDPSGPDTIVLAGNTYTLNAAYGGYDFYSDNGLVVISSEVTIEGNGATIERDSGAPHFRLLAVNSTGSLTLNNTTLSGGYSEEDGGGLYIDGGGEALVQGSTFTGNVAFDDGGAMEVDEAGTLIIDNTLIEYNDAGENGGGVSAEPDATLTIRNGSRMRENYAYEGGGGLVTEESGLVTIDNSTVSDNEAGYFGGGIATYATEIIIQNNATISGNEAAVYGGGADFYLSEVTITDSQISGNYANYQGGGLHLDGSNVTIERSTIHDNHTEQAFYGYAGGGIFNGAVALGGGDYTYGDLTVSETTISSNSSFFGGGIVNLEGNRVTVRKSTLNDNTALFGGGFGNGGGKWTIINSTLSGNRAVEVLGIGGLGGAIGTGADPSYYYLYDSLLLLSTVTGNEAANQGGGIVNVYGPMAIVGSIVSGNAAVGDGQEIYSYSYSGVSTSGWESVLGDNGKTSATAFYNVVINPNSIVATSDGTQPTPLAGILDPTLADNGGPTKTHALVADSPAVDFVSDDLCDPATPLGDLTDDQRSEPRNIDIPGMGNDGNDEVCDVGAYELQLPAAGAFCPADVEGVGYLRTAAIGVGQGSPTKGIKTRQLVIPDYQDVVSLYGQLAAVDTGLMKYVRFLPQGAPKVQIATPTSPAYRPFAVDWWGSDLPTGGKWVKGQFFWGKTGARDPRAFILWPTYETDEAYANAFVTFDESSENHVAWEAGFITTQQQTMEIPEVQEDGATVNITVALVDVNNDSRSVVLTVEAGDVSEKRVVTVPNRKDTLNLEQFELENVDAGTDEVVITLESPLPGDSFPSGGDSAAMIGAAANYACGEAAIPPIAPGPGAPATSGYWQEMASRLTQQRAQPARLDQTRVAGEKSSFLRLLDGIDQGGRGHRAEDATDR